MRYFLGRPDGIASQFETLVFETERNNSESDDFGDSIDIDASENFNEEEIRFADFVRRYNQSIHVKTFFNPWSDMRWKLVQGEITTWRSVVNYSKENPHTRTAKIVSEICKLTLLERLNLDEDDVLLNKEISPF
jgi:hypothetical protein